MGVPANADARATIHGEAALTREGASAPARDLARRKERAALVSVAVKLALTLAKFTAALLSGSLALASEAGNNLGDVAVTVLSFLSIRAAARPADEDHQFGHGKVEAVSALVQTGFLFALALFILIEAVKRLASGGGDVEPGAFAFAVLGLSIVVDLARWTSLRRIAKATRSEALAADALNFATDIVAALMALAGLVATAYGVRLGDTLAALGVAAFVAIAGFDLGRRTVDTLVDAAPRGLTGPLRQIIAGVPGVLAVRELRLRPIGADIIGEAVIRVSRTLSIERVAAMKDEIRAAIAAAHPEATVLVTAEPVALDDETVVERVLLVAARRRVPVHHVTVQRLGSRQAVSFDAELDGRLSLGQSHDLVSALEAAIGDELGAGFEVESHIEPLELAEMDGRDCDGAMHGAITEALRRNAPGDGALTSIHDVRVRETANGLVVNYHCLADGNLSVRAIHDHVDALDRKVRQDFAAIARIVGHAEPVRAGGG